MKKKSILYIVNIMFAVSFVFFAISCGTKSTEPESNTDTPQIDTQGSKTKSDQAYQMIENEMDKAINGKYNNASDYDQLKFDGANALYKEAISLNPDNLEAQFGAAITEIMSAYSDSDINQLIKDCEQSFKDYDLGKIVSNPLLPTKPSNALIPVEILAGNVYFLNKVAIKDPPLISRVQQVFSEKLLPRIEYAIERLNIIEQHTDFQFVVSAKMQGDLDLKSVKIYITEAEFMNAALCGLKSAIEIFLVYNFDLPNYDKSTLLDALNQNNTTFFVLKSDSQQRVESIKNNFNLMLTKAKTGINYLETITGKKSDAVIKIGSGDVKQNDLDSVKKYLNMAINSLSQNVALNLKSADSEGNDYTININIGNFLVNLPENPKKDLLPPYTITSSGSDKFDIKFAFDAGSYDEFNFPDPTIKGLLPGMSNETLKRLLQIDEEYAFELYTWVNDGIDYYYNKPNYTLTLYTSANTYSLNSDYYGSFNKLFRDATSIPQIITKMELTAGGEKIELYQANTNYEQLAIQAKKSTYAEVMIRTPKNLFVNSDQTNKRIELTWADNNPNTYYGYYDIYRKTNNGSFVKIVDGDYFYMFNYYDYNVTAGNTYTYRIEQGIDSYSLNSGWSHVLVPVQKRKSSEVSVSY